MAGAFLNSAIPFLTATDRRQCVLMVCTYYTFAYMLAPSIETRARSSSSSLLLALSLCTVYNRAIAALPRLRQDRATTEAGS